MKKHNYFQGSIFNLLGSIFKNNNVPPIIVGGYALAAYNIKRMTFDIDMMVSFENIFKIEQALINANYSIYNKSKAFVQFSSDNMGLRDIDIIICDKKTINIILKNSKTISIAKYDFIIPNIVHIIAMKLHSISCNKDRENKDFSDIKNLISANNLNQKDKSIVTLFKKYDLMNLYEKI